MEAIVLYPTPAVTSHLISMVELGKHILTSNPSLSIHILVATSPFNAGETAAYIAGVSATTPSITFHHLPPISLPPEISFAPGHNFFTLTFEVIRLNKPNVSQALISISENDTIQAFIVDFFCASTLSVSADLNIPTYFFFTSGAANLASHLYLPTLDETILKKISFEDLDNTPLNIPGMPSNPSLDTVKPHLDPRDKAYKYFLESSTYYAKSNGIIVNTFESLEPGSVKAITEGLCIPDAPTPPIYCIGPLITSKEQKGPRSECLKWLDSQPRQSVVFLCFGSLGLFSEEQLKEIALGLERSGQRFLWVVRNPPPQKNQGAAISVSTDVDLDSLLPQGFLDRMKERGLVVKNWAPQVEVLRHESVGGFVTHCGWNSVLESISAGVPMVAWPLYAEQRFNKVVMVKEIKIALPMNESNDYDGFVSASEVEKRVNELITSSESGDLVRKRALSMKDEAKAALSDGGSSRVALTKLQLWKRC